MRSSWIRVNLKPNDKCSDRKKRGHTDPGGRGHTKAEVGVM